MLKNVSQNEAVDKVKTEKLNIFDFANWPTNISFSSHLLFPSSTHCVRGFRVVKRGFHGFCSFARGFRNLCFRGQKIVEVFYRFKQNSLVTDIWDFVFHKLI